MELVFMRCNSENERQTSSNSMMMTRNRRKSVSLPISYLLTTAVGQKPPTTRKGVHFPISVLLQQAITVGDLIEINQLVRDNGNNIVEEREPSGLPPVMRAIFEGQLDSLKLLTNVGADLTTTDSEGWNVLHVAAAMDDIDSARFVARSCNQPLTQVRNADGQRPIDLAESPEMARFLLQVDLQDLRLETEVMSKWLDPTESSVLNTVRHHYQNNQSVDFLNVMLQSQTQFDSLLHLAAARNYPRLTRYVLKHQLVDPDIRDRQGFTPIHIAAFNGSIDTLLLLIQYGASIHTLTDSYEKTSDLTDNELIIEILNQEENIQHL